MDLKLEPRQRFLGSFPRASAVAGLMVGFCSSLAGAQPTSGSAAGAITSADFLPATRPWHGASERLIARADDPWITPSEKTGLTDTPNYDDTIVYLRKLASAFPAVLTVQEFGRTSQGRALIVVVASRARSLTADGLRATGRPTVLAQAGIHAGEIDGKDAGLMLLRDIAAGPKASLLDEANFLFVPVFNADGHERVSEWNRPNQRGPVHQGWRTTAQNLNLNRDYMKADAPEMQAMIALLNQWSPALYLDLHVTDGMDYQYDITFGYNGDTGVFAWSTRLGAWLNQTYRPAVEAALQAAGHVPGPVIDGVDPRDPRQGISLGTAMPRYSTGYGDLRHLATVLVENHSLKPYRQRVLGTYILLESSLRTVGAHAKQLEQAIAADRASRRELLPMNWGADGGGAGTRSSMDFLGIDFENYVSPATGGREVRWLGTPMVFTNVPVFLDQASLQLKRPKAYWVPVSKPEVIARLKLHGIQMETLTAARTVRVEMNRMVKPVPQRGEGTHPFESRHALKAGVTPEVRTETFPSGSVRVPADQPLGDLAMALLEPAAHDSLFAWGFFLEILQRTEYIEGYALAPLAERMLASDSKLKAEFEAKLAEDSKFAGDPAARMQWFYARSPYSDERYLLYPVGIER
jgi:hypothetical protein